MARKDHCFHIFCDSCNNVRWIDIYVLHVLLSRKGMLKFFGFRFTKKVLDPIFGHNSFHLYLRECRIFHCFVHILILNARMNHYTILLYGPSELAFSVKFCFLWPLPQYWMPIWINAEYYHMPHFLSINVQIWLVWCITHMHDWHCHVSYT